MRVVLNTYPTAFDKPAGGERQLMDLREALPAHGIRALLFDQWNPCLDDVDVVHYFSVVGGSIHFCGYIKKLGIPLVVSPNLWITGENYHRFPTNEISEQLAMADKIVVSSKLEADNYKMIFPGIDERLSIVHAGISPHFMKTEDGQLMRDVLNVHGPFLLSVGSVTPERNHINILHAISRFPQLKLICMGEIGDEAYARQCIDMAGDQVIFIGAVPHSAPLLRSAMAACTAFVGASESESTSMAALEAAAQGAPVIISESGTMREYFGDDAYYINPGDWSDIARAVGEVIESNPENVLKSQNAVLSNYSLINVARSMSRIYRNMVNG